MKKNVSILGLLGILILVVFVSGCTSSNNTTNQSSNVTVQITSNSPWNGTLTYNGTDHKVNGTSNATYNLGISPGAVTIYLNNINGGNSTVQLLQDDKVIQTQTTSENQQVVSISHNF